MKLLAYTLNGQILGVDKTSWDDTDFIGFPFTACTDNAIIPSGYTDISSILNWGKFGEECGLNYVKVRNEIKKYLLNESFSDEEIAVLKRYNLYKYYRIYDQINDANVIISDHPPIDLDYDLMGFNKKRFFNKGELERVEYYENYTLSATTFSVKTVEEIRTYNRINQMLSSRVMSINWILSDDTTGFTKNTVKYYTPIEAIQAGETRRSNLISNLKITVIGILMQFSGASSIIAQQVGTPFLDKYSIDIAKYIQGYEQQLKDAIDADDEFNWLNLVIPNTGGITVRQYLISELTIDYTINNTHV